MGAVNTRLVMIRPRCKAHHMCNECRKSKAPQCGSKGCDEHSEHCLIYHHGSMLDLTHPINTGEARCSRPDTRPRALAHEGTPLVGGARA